MYILRAMPKRIPEGRNYVVDQIEQVFIDNYDMRFLTELDDDLILIEWDIAAAMHDLHNMIVHCRQAPTQIHVAPYPLYPVSLDELMAPVWAHRHMIQVMPQQLEWIDYGDTVCDIFSTGMVYFPLEVLQRLKESDELITWHSNIDDSKIAFWYYSTFKKKVAVHWDVRPIHLHYDQGVFYDDRLGIWRRDTPRPAGISARQGA
jgi:hypothetical protein